MNEDIYNYIDTELMTNRYRTAPEVNLRSHQEFPEISVAMQNLRYQQRGTSVTTVDPTIIENG